MIWQCLLLHHIFQIHRYVNIRKCVSYIWIIRKCVTYGLYGELSYLDKIGDSMWIKRTQYKNDSTFKINK